MYFATGLPQYLSRVENMGEFLTLQDRSKWRVNPFDKFKTMSWLMAEQVVVAAYIGTKYQITHLGRKETIEAELISK